MPTQQINNLTDTEKLAFYEAVFEHHPDFFFVFDFLEKKFLYTNKSLKLLLQITNFTPPEEQCSRITQLLHPEDVKVLDDLQKQILNNHSATHFTTELRVIAQKNEYKHFKIKLSVLATDNHGNCTQVVGVASEFAPVKSSDTAVGKSSLRLGELSFLASQELGQEYAKIQSIIQLLDNKFITEAEKTDLINEAKKAIQIINSSIFKINHQLSFNQADEFFEEPEADKKVYKRIILIDDDVLTNVLNKKLINTIVPDKPLNIFLNIDDAITYLQDRDTDGDYLIFLDINFPDRNGWDFLEEYNLFEVKSKVVVLSSSIDNRDRDKARSYQVVIDYITKPLSMEFIKNLFE